MFTNQVDAARCTEDSADQAFLPRNASNSRNSPKAAITAPVIKVDISSRERRLRVSGAAMENPISRMPVICKEQSGEVSRRSRASFLPMLFL